MRTNAPKGTRDILPEEIYRWHHAESIIRDLCRIFGFREIRVPLFEHTELFARGVGETTDIVQKEMYTFPDKAGRSLTLRPEGTAGVVRAYIENGMSSLVSPQKLYYYGPMYRYENVQRGRYREFWQFGCETFGAVGPEADVEIISILSMFFARLGLPKVDLRVNSIGCPACRPAYHALLREYLKARLDKLCADCNDRYVRNPLRVIDCKNERCQAELADAPMSLDHICGQCAEHFEGLKSGLSALGIAFEIDKTIVRGLDYYTRTVFEFYSENVKSLGAAICGGGRYDGLVGVCGGAETPGVGFSVGIERLFIELESYGVSFPEPAGPDVFFVAVGERAKAYAARLVNELRENGRGAGMDLLGRSVKAQMKYADRLKAGVTVVIGDNELDGGRFTLRSMADGTTRETDADNLLSELLK